MAFLELHESAKNDLRVIRSLDRISFLRIMAILEQIECDPNLQNGLLEPRFEQDDIAFSRWVRQFNIGNNLYRMKMWSVCGREDGLYPLNYRVIYAYYPKESSYVVLGVVPRGEFDYDDKSNAYACRILRDYYEIC